jgi:D-alanyl-D-alanine endopeptidase (penicillin-binding protein 7)
VDPDRLALYSASALVIDQVTVSRCSTRIHTKLCRLLPSPKLMTAMVVLDAKLDLQGSDQHW